MPNSARVLVDAPAKINLFLDITGRAENGYHLLDSVMQAVSLTDRLYITRREDGDIRVTCTRPGIPEDSSNLAYKAAALYLKRHALPPCGIHIHIDKRIPSQAGLGGGSADAAGVLVGMDRLFRRNTPPDILCEWGLALGADVPFALLGGCGLVRGIGERIAPIPRGLQNCHIVIAKPIGGVDTREAYRQYDRLDTPCRGDVNAVLDAVRAGDAPACGKGLFNVFEQVCTDAATTGIKLLMAQSGATGALLTGSGSAVFGIFPSAAQARDCAARLPELAAEIFSTEPLPHGPSILWEDNPIAPN